MRLSFIALIALCLASAGTPVAGQEGRWIPLQVSKSTVPDWIVWSYDSTSVLRPEADLRRVWLRQRPSTAEEASFVHFSLLLDLPAEALAPLERGSIGMTLVECRCSTREFRVLDSVVKNPNGTVIKIRQYAPNLFPTDWGTVVPETLPERLLKAVCELKPND